MDNIHGMIMRPGSSSYEENEQRWKASDFYIDSNFHGEYRKHKVAMQHVAECAKIYILKHWKEIKDWSKLDVAVRDNTGSVTKYYCYEPIKTDRKSSVVSSILKKIDKEDKKNQNPIIEIKDVILDTMDGDFSLTINGKKHLWIDNESIILISAYIEKIKEEKANITME